MKATQLTLISHAATAAQRSGCFPIDADDVHDLAPPTLTLPENSSALTGPELRAVHTADLLGLTSTVEPELRDCNFGRWKGMRLKELQQNEPTLLQAWLTDPDFSSHGGESIAEVCQRVALWLGSFTVSGRWVAVTHPMIVRAAMMHVLQCPLAAFHRVDVSPLSQLHLGHYDVWRVKLNAME